MCFVGKWVVTNAKGKVLFLSLGQTRNMFSRQVFAKALAWKILWPLDQPQNNHVFLCCVKLKERSAAYVLLKTPLQCSCHLQRFCLHRKLTFEVLYCSAAFTAECHLYKDCGPSVFRFRFLHFATPVCRTHVVFQWEERSDTKPEHTERLFHELRPVLKLTESHPLSCVLQGFLWETIKLWLLQNDVLATEVVDTKMVWQTEFNNVVATLSVAQVPVIDVLLMLSMIWFLCVKSAV